MHFPHLPSPAPGLNSQSFSVFKYFRAKKKKGLDALNCRYIWVMADLYLMRLKLRFTRQFFLDKDKDFYALLLRGLFLNKQKKHI